MAATAYMYMYMYHIYMYSHSSIHSNWNLLRHHRATGLESPRGHLSVLYCAGIDVVEGELIEIAQHQHKTVISGGAVGERRDTGRERGRERGKEEGRGGREEGWR